MLLKERVFLALRNPIAHSVGRSMPVLFENDDQRAAAHTKIAKMVRGDFDPEKVHLGRAAVCNNVIDSYESRFHETALRQIARKLPSTQMACGHDMGGWSYARMYDARIREPENARAYSGERLRELRDLAQATWVDGDFYWPRAASWAADLNERLRYFEPEVSAHWQFDLAVCSLCNDDLRKCDHFPGDVYEGKKCWYEMRDVTEYIETSFVVKGGQFGTSSFPISAAASRSFMPFGLAIREMKSNRRLLGEWRDSIKDELKAARNANGSGKNVFARALAKQTQV